MSHPNGGERTDCEGHCAPPGEGRSADHKTSGRTAIRTVDSRALPRSRKPVGPAKLEKGHTLD